MKFGEVPVSAALDSYLAHSIRTAEGRIRKGELLTPDLVQQLQADGVQSVIVARLDAQDVHEDEAARQLAHALAGNGIRLGRPGTGRVNLHAHVDGVCDFDRQLIDQVNLIDEGITVATVYPSSAVGRGRLVATVKIIPYAVTQDALRRALAVLQGKIHVHAAKPHRAVLIQTRLPSLRESVLDKTVGVTRQRLLNHGVELLREYRVHHTVQALVDGMATAMQCSMDWLLVAGASAVADREDLIPAAIRRLGGEIHHYGMPMDPGNLLLLGSVGGKPVVGLPGCARSPRTNGLDKVLERLSCQLPVDRHWFASLGVGGLLHEIVDRPAPRVPTSADLKISALVLAAGSSRRFGASNKLLARRGSVPLLAQVLQSLRQSMLEDILVVTGHDAGAVSDLCDAVNRDDGTQVSRVHNPLHASGMASSLICGIAELSEQGADAVLVCLGDMPEAGPQVMNTLAMAFRQNPGKALYIPVFEGQRGNPVVIAASLFDSVLMLEGDVGARVLARQFPDSVLEVPCESAGVLLDIDVPDDLRGP